MSFLNRFLDESPDDDALQSVARHLGNILGGKRGFASHVHAYGVVKFTAEVTGQNVAKVLMQEIMDNIASYEPRLAVRGLQALEKDSLHRLHLILRGEIEQRPCIMHLAFSMTQGWLAVVDASWEVDSEP